MQLKTTSINNTSLEYVESGDPSAPPLILIHGWAQDHRLFRLLEPHLRDHFRVLRLNFRGHDGSAGTPADFTAEDLIQDTVEFIEQLDLEDVRIASTSHGCWVNIGVQERLGAKGFGQAVVIDWLLKPFDGFHQQIEQGASPDTVAAARQSMFDEWTEGTDSLDVIDHVQREMTWFGESMWMRACREISKSYSQWENPLERMKAVPGNLEVAHIYSQPLDPEYRKFQEEFAAGNPWFTPIHIPGKTHFPTLENPESVAAAIKTFFS
ncbi:alpha/beta fold hydrolase [Paenarthrobacter aurescens]|uniref:alpha/beta fold hydrolase n=1 Tax=Paenarthrobacter aurescens TaxID=43663 RepID=UPI0021C2129A|nr:alpha/beta hydrolase [Paenarthrobacter aurescens]